MIGLASVLLAGLLSTAVFAGSWPMYRADAARSGVTSQRLGGELALRWVYRPLHAPKPAWPPPAEELPRTNADNAYHVAIDEHRVYFGSSVTGKLYAVDAKQGTVAWTFFAEGPVRFAPTIVAGRVYFGSDDGHVYCLDATSGQLIWKYRAGPSDEKVIGNGHMISLWPVRTSVLVVDDTVYFTAGVFPYEGLYVGGLNAADGSEVWKNDTVGDRAHELEYGGISPHGYLLASSDVLYVPSGRAMPAAFDRHTGKLLFYASPGSKRGGTWALLDKGRLIAGVDHSGTPEKVIYDGRTGEQEGDAFAWFPGIDMSVAPETAYVVTRDGLFAMDRKAYARAVDESNQLAAQQKQVVQALAVWRKKQSQRDVAARDPQIAGKIATLTGTLHDLTARRAQLKKSSYRWRRSQPGLISVIRAGNSVLAGGRGIVLRLAPDTGEIVWQHAVDGNAVGLAVADGQLLVSTDTGYVYCFGQPLPSGRQPRSIARAAAPPDEKALSTLYHDAAQRIVADAGITKGYALVLDCGEGRLACELARRTELKIIGIERDPAKLALARARAEAAGLLGTRVVIEPWDVDTLPDWFANLVVSDGMLQTGKTSTTHAQRHRLVRPWGGVACLSLHENGKVVWKRLERGPLAETGSWTQQYANPRNTACSDDHRVNGPLGMLWFGEPGPQGMVERHGGAQAPVAMDGRLFVEGEEQIMAVDAFNGTPLWRRDIPGAVRVKIKNDSGNLVITKTGLYVAAHDTCYRLDPATGKTLHVYELPEHGDRPRRWGYLSVVGHILYGSAAMPFHGEYAAVLKQFLDHGAWRAPDRIPAAMKTTYAGLRKRYPDPHDLRMAAERSGLLYRTMGPFGRGGAFTQNKPVTDGLLFSDRVFAIDTESGELLWKYDGTKIANITCVLGDGKIFFADQQVTDQDKRQAIEQRRTLWRAGVYQKRKGVPTELAEREQERDKLVARKQAMQKSDPQWIDVSRRIYQFDYMIESLRSELTPAESDEGTLTADDFDIRNVIALDARTGEQAWKRPVDLTGCCGDRMGAAYQDGLLLFFGNYGNHDAWRFRVGGLKWRRITTLRGEDGTMVWSRPLNYRTRPVIVGEKIIVEPRACRLRTGETIMRRHPITGNETPWEFLRPGHTCGITAASADGLFYRSACTAFYDLARDRGITIFGGYRPGCAISVIPACGLLLSPEAAAGCTCSYPIRCSMALIRKPKRQQPWTVYVTPGALRPVRHLAINLGAVADMKAKDGTVWFGYPNPNTSSFSHFPNYGVKFDLQEEILPGTGYFCRDFKGRTIGGTDKPWLFTSGCVGFRRCQIPLIDATAGQPPAVYTVRLGLRNPPGDRPGQRVFDIRLQNRTVEENCDVSQPDGTAGSATVRVFPGIDVDDTLLLELVPKAAQPTGTSAPVLNFIEIVREP